MNDTREKVLTGILADVEAEISRLETVRAFLREELGRDGTDPAAGLAAQTPATPAATPTTTPGGLPPPSLAVQPGEFFGFSATKATAILLERIGRTRPLGTREIFEAIRAGGVSIRTPAYLYKSLDRDSRFHKPTRGRWGLSAWYPAAARKAREGGAEPGEDDDMIDDMIDPSEAGEGSPGEVEQGPG